ncbi:uncharacterized protein LOC126377031 [Pectinophora gossypiella]|uniref:uncharacterized protein LOC126377031 n=1 Tax=Pectinophora gossypiella TaxID=13191 RepID=UPI00214E2237|nr:uncharacterized protein LOC126377031 [Pectinophora gossypiella]
MLSKFHKNAVLTGYIDSYCLACESHLRSEEDINVHIAKPIHLKNLEATSFLEKYKDDYVRKVKKGYYCEFCNLLLSTAAKVGLHVVEEKHVNNKGALLLRRFGNVILAFDYVLISERAWHGLIDETCAVCNNEFDDENIHKTESTHILNLVQSKVEFGVDKTTYRKIDNSSFQCLTCNMVLSLNSITTHFQEEGHKTIYQACHQAYLELDLKVASEAQVEKPKAIEPITSVPKATKKPEPKAETKAAPKVEKQTEEKTIKKTEQEVKKQEPAKKTATTEVPKKESSEAKKKKKPKLDKITRELDEEICNTLDARDYITRDEKGQQWCLLCDWTMDSVVINNHVNGRHHQTMLKLHNERIQNQSNNRDDSPQIDETEKKVEEKINKEEQEDREKILDSVSRFQKNDVNINFVTGTAMCKKCSKNVDFVYKSIEAHIEEHMNNAAKKETVKPTAETNNKPTNVKTTSSTAKSQPTKNDEEKAEPRATPREEQEEIEKLAKEYDFTYSKESNKVYCKICASRIPPSLANMKQHANGASHKNKAAKVLGNKHNKPVIDKRPMKEVIKNIVCIENAFMKDVIINEILCINYLSFLMITCIGQVRCQVCEANLQGEQIHAHVQSPNHSRAMSETPVILSYESEFIREVRPSVYHCGFCNVVESKEGMYLHLCSTMHREAKTSSSWRLQQYQPELALHERRQQLEMYMLMRMLAEIL